MNIDLSLFDSIIKKILRSYDPDVISDGIRALHAL
jgi:hypothetical protein